MDPNNHAYAAVLDKVIDGDTYDLLADVGFRCYVKVRVRLHGIDVYEHTTPQGQSAITFVLQAFQSGHSITLESFKDERSFERWVCDVWIDGVLLADTLRSEGYAKPIEHLG